MSLSSLNHRSINNNVDVESVFERFGIVIKNENTETRFDSDGLVVPVPSGQWQFFVIKL